MLRGYNIYFLHSSFQFLSNFFYKSIYSTLLKFISYLINNECLYIYFFYFASILLMQNQKQFYLIVFLPPFFVLV